mmetsp:Transcript_101127/g.225919  ORF Transcript_101127/g.225919 Transcript_101127/m.225919 type:complete len:211 (+) Transcript_101127:1155-1787(+)
MTGRSLAATAAGVAPQRLVPPVLPTGSLPKPAPPGRPPHGPPPGELPPGGLPPGPPLGGPLHVLPPGQSRRQWPGHFPRMCPGPPPGQSPGPMPPAPAPPLRRHLSQPPPPLCSGATALATARPRPSSLRPSGLRPASDDVGRCGDCVTRPSPSTLRPPWAPKLQNERGCDASSEMATTAGIQHQRHEGHHPARRQPFGPSRTSLENADS